MSKVPQPQRAGASHSQVNYVHIFRNEISLLRLLKHPNVVNLLEVYEDKRNFYAVMEKYDGGELFNTIVNRRRIPEPAATRLCRDMLAAVLYIQSQNVIHRDIKAENFLLSSEKVSSSRLVLIDFGMSVKLDDPDRFLRQVCGSPHYVAPEVIKRCYRREVDMWALGIVVFLMLYGRYPFEGKDQAQIAQKILRAEPDYGRSAVAISASAIDFIRGLLHKSPGRRMTPEQALNHPWLLARRVELAALSDQPA